MVTARQAPRPHDATLALFAKLRATGERRIRDAIVRANLGLVVTIAHRYQGRGLDLDDLVQCGSIGLLKAVDKFDPRRGARFSTCAGLWIAHEIRRALADTGCTIRLPQHFVTLTAKVEKARGAAHAELGHDPTREQLAKAAGVSVRKVASLEHYVDAPISLDELDEFDVPLVERVPA